MSEQKLRRPAFEAWADPQGFSLLRIRPDQIDPSGQYRDDDTQAAWEAWKAASSQLSALRASHAELVEALKPFANYACLPVSSCACHNCTARIAIKKAEALK